MLRLISLAYLTALFLSIIQLDIDKNDNALFDCVKTDETPTTFVCERGNFDPPYQSIAQANFILSITIGWMSSLYGVYQARSFIADLAHKTRATLALCFGKTGCLADTPAPTPSFELSGQGSRGYGATTQPRNTRVLKGRF
jgi:hypothetical protein